MEAPLSRVARRTGGAGHAIGFWFGRCTCGNRLRRNDQGTAAAELGSMVMKSKAHKHEPDQQDDDVWTWVVIGLVFAAVALALYGPLVWQATHNAL
jgi:hypothetical protein